MSFTAAFENQRKPDMGNGLYRNPILGGDYPDPSIIRVGEMYYMTHSSFLYHPGLLIWQSRDLVNWQPLTFAVDHRGWDIWAPELVHCRGLFFIYYFARNTETEAWLGKNWVVHADNIEGPWSEPVALECGHIDPGHVVGPDGKRYLHLSGGHMVDLSDDGLALKGEPVKVYDGWDFPRDRWPVEGFCLEGPKLMVREGWYYLISAQGGTAGPATSHMVTASRSSTPWGPWEDSPYNPVIHTESREERWWSRGHGTLIDTPEGDWWMVYHGYEKDFHTLGRQTLLEPIEWTEDGWFRVPEGVDPAAPIPAAQLEKTAAGEATHYMPLSDDFSGDALGAQWRRFDLFDPARVAVGDGELTLRAEGQFAAPSEPLLVTPIDPVYTLETEVDVAGLQGDSCAGLVLFYNFQAFCGIQVMPDGRVIVAREGNISMHSQDQVDPAKPVRLRLVNDRHQVSFAFSQNGADWTRLWTNLEVSGMHHNVFGGFLSLRAGLMAVGGGKARFRRFAYRAELPE